MKAVRVRTIALVAVVAFVLASCSSSGSTSSDTGAATPSLGDPTTDKLAAILARGTLVLSTDPAYPPQSFAVKGATRAANTKCAENELTAPEIDGYDAATGKLVAAALGVEPCFVTPTWTEITGGNWGDRWDVSWGSGGINGDRMDRLYMTQPYYTAPQSFFVATDSTFRKPSDLDGQKIGACASCTHELYLEGTLEVPGVKIVQKVQDPKVVLFDTEQPGLQAVADGKIAAFLLSEPVGNEAIKEGLSLRELKEPAFPLYLTGFVDKSSALDQRAFVARVNEIILGLIANGKLPAMSEKYFGTDYATGAAQFDLGSIGQEVVAP
jgi:polar amino acid transport system substrate-binding protein